MNIERFGQYLVNCGLLDEGVIFEALNIQRKKTTPIAQHALYEEDMLTMKQVFTILNYQTETGKKFGEVAMDLGCLTEGDVEKLLAIQKESRPRIGEILVEMGKMSKIQCKDMLEKFHRSK